MPPRSLSPMRGSPACCACVGAAATATPSATAVAPEKRCRLALIRPSSLSPGEKLNRSAGGAEPACRSASHAEIAVLQRDIGAQLGRRALPHDAAFLQHVVAIGDAGQRLDILVDEQNGL